MSELIWQNSEELREWLTAVHIPLHTWGQNGAKTVAALWQELLAGDCQLQMDPPQRQVHVAEIVVQRDNYVLIEAAQELADGQIRERGILPAEKMKTGENLVTAVYRACQEELNLSPPNITILPDTYIKTETIQHSPSYPGLPTHYTLHRLNIHAKGLPDDDFWVDNIAHGQGDPVKRHLWRWRLAKP